MARAKWEMNGDGTRTGYLRIRCPGCTAHFNCDWSHAMGVEIRQKNGAQWKFNGDLDRPTLDPSVLFSAQPSGAEYRCHSFVKNGQIQFLNDCTHELAGQTLDLPEIG